MDNFYSFRDYLISFLIHNHHIPDGYNQDLQKDYWIS